MPAKAKSRKAARPASDELTPFQVESIGLFVKAAAVLSLPRTAGLVYGLLFSTPRPLNIDEMSAMLNASRGGTWEGLDWLRQMGAVERVYVPGVRKDHYRAEVNLRQLAGGLLRMRVEPHMQNAPANVSRLRKAIANGHPDADFQKERANKVANWHRVLSGILPMVKTLAGEK